MPNTNRNLIVASEKLFLYNNILNEFDKDHDILTFSYNPKISKNANAKAIYRNLNKHLQGKYDKIVFMGLESDCNLLHELYIDKALTFDAAIFVNYRKSEIHGLDLRTQQNTAHHTPIYSFSVRRNDTVQPLAYLKEHHNVPSLFRSIRSKRLAKEIYGVVVYGIYELNFLEGTPSKLIK